MIEEKIDASLDGQLFISPQTFVRLSKFVTAKLGIQLPESKQTMIQSRLLRRVKALGLRNIEEYCQRIFALDETELVHFTNAVTTNKTDFFREPQHFTYLTQKVLPHLASSARTRSSGVSIWSAPCSSGEEVYTTAMVLSEYAEGKPNFSYRILGTDISTRVLDLARRGIYSREQISPVPQHLRRKYLLSGRGERESLVRIVPALRQAVSFQQLNLMDENYKVQGYFDVIFCRNVLIYFDRATQQSVIQKLCRYLKPSGYLFIGHSESLSGMDVPLDFQGTACFRKKASGMDT